MKKARSAKPGVTTKRISSKRRSVKAGSPKAHTAPRHFDEYLATVPEQCRKALIMMREAIRTVVPAEATEVISYGIPAFKHKRVLVWFGGFAGHCSLFPTAAVVKAFEGELKGYPTSKGTIQFPLSRPMPIALIKKLVKARAAAE